MPRFLLRRTLQALGVLAVVLSAVFFLARLTGDPTNLYLPLQASEEVRDAFRAANGLDRPMAEQYRSFVSDAVQLDFGDSLLTRQPALQTVLDRLSATLLLAGVTIGIAAGGAVLLAVVASIRPGGVAARVISALSVLGATIPDFWLGLMFILVFAVQLQWLPTSGSGGIEFLVLPVATLLIRPLGRIAEVLRTTMSNELSAEYVVTAQAAGLSRSRVLWRQVLPNSLLPSMTVTGDELAQLINGAILVEVVFGWPGIGKLTVDAVTQRDFPTVQAIVFVVAALTFVLNTVIDVLYSLADPRVEIH